MNEEPKIVVDCVGLFCPQPIFQTRQALDKLSPGEVLKLIADDPSAEQDIKAFLRKTGDELLKIDRDGNNAVFYIRKK